MVVVPTSRMTMSDFIIKPRRKKKLDVPVHRNSKEPNIKTYSAQFSGRKHPTKEKSVDFQEYKSFPSIKSASCDDLDLALVDEQENRPRSTSRKKYLKAEIERLKRDNKVLSEKVENIEEHYNKKLGKCKEKVDTVQSYNEEIINQYNILKEHYEELLSNYQGVVDELETCKNCKTCEELKKVVHRNNEDYNRVKAVNKGLTEDVTMLKTVVYR